jgi:hypothetical protein
MANSVGPAVLVPDAEQLWVRRLFVGKLALLHRDRNSVKIPLASSRFVRFWLAEDPVFASTARFAGLASLLAAAQPAKTGFSDDQSSLPVQGCLLVFPDPAMVDLVA